MRFLIALLLTVCPIFGKRDSGGSELNESVDDYVVYFSEVKRLSPFVQDLIEFTYFFLGAVFVIWFTYSEILRIARWLFNRFIDLIFDYINVGFIPVGVVILLAYSAEASTVIHSGAESFVDFIRSKPPVVEEKPDDFAMIAVAVCPFITGLVYLAYRMFWARRAAN